MSAYIVEDTTINKVVTWLVYELIKNPYLRRDAGKFKVDMEGNGWEQRLAQAMHDLNVEAVNQRYHEENPFDKFVYRPEPYGSRIAVFKSLRCWKYECTEGTVPEMNLFKYFGVVEKHLAVDIVTDLPAYAQATWG
jgi:hypothetical protein